MTTAGPADGPAAGWYPDPGQASTLRYWDGTAWTAHVSPVSEPHATVRTDAAPPDNAAIIIVGYVAAFLMPIVGLIIGLTQLRRGGLGVILASFMAFVFWLALMLAIFSRLG